MISNGYIYDGQVYADKTPLIGKTNKARLWFYDDEFSKYDWSKEPEESIDDLYIERCKKLREEYDHLILMYSGGADSHNILSTFIFNGLHLDEVHTVYPLKMIRAIQETEYPDNYNLSLLKEYDGATVPRLKMLSLYHPKTKTMVWDMSDFITDMRTNDNFMEDNKRLFVVHSNKFRALMGAYMYQELSRYILQYSNKKIGIIFGFDRPNLSINDGGLYFNFTELGRCFVVNFDWGQFCDPILFYWHPDYTKIIIKQCHLVKKFLELTGSSVLPHKDAYVMRKILYPRTFEPEYYQQPLLKKHHDDDILRFIYGKKEAENITMLNQLKINFATKKYKIGEICPSS